MVTPANAYPVATLARKYADGFNGVIRSCLVQPSVRSVATRVPLEISPDIAPNETSPTM